MKRCVFLVGSVVLAFTAAVPAQSQGVSAEQELIRLEHEWTNADLKMDWAIVDRILADDYILADGNGEVYFKKQCKAHYEPGAGQV